MEIGGLYRYVDSLLEGVIPAYHAVDARASWRFSDSVAVSVEGQNLFDAHHAELNAVPVEVRRSVFLQLVINR